ncbi:MAG: hypothetical protein LUQ65_08495 [Candidatus Helarchaeota archaeon]|nr:hypothetical protein [Candidatus Helarchaeota archaeon]
MDFQKLLKENIPYFIGIVLIIALCIVVLLIKPHASAPAILDPTLGNFYNLVTFGLGLDSTVLIWLIAGFLLYRWAKGGRSNKSLLVWGLGFFIYSVTFFAHILKGWGIPWANENASPATFFLWRFGMILWAGGSLYGILRILVKDRKTQILPPIAVIVVGFIWFIYGLFFAGDPTPIESTMYTFLFAIWIPICFSISYIFLLYGRRSKSTGPKILFIGYLGLTITYMGWAPWHFSNVIYFYFVWYFLFLLSLIPILIGFILLSRETESG